MGVEIVEVRLMLSATGEVDAAVTQSNAVVDQYSAAAAQQQYLAPVQSELQAALDSFIAGTAAATSTIGVDQASSDTSLGGLAGAFGNTSANVTTVAQQVLSAAQSSGIQTSSTVNAAAGSGTSGSSSASLFDQGTNLQSIADNLGTSAFGNFGTSSGTTAGTGSQTGGTTPSSGDGGSASTSSGGSTSNADSGSGTAGDSDSSSSNDDSSDSSSGGGWQPFVLPDGIVFEDVHLPAEEFAENLSLLQPTGTDSFSNTTITEDASEGTTTRLTVTLSQSYLGAERWIVTQSWTKEYTIHASSGERVGSWSESTRHGSTTLTITVSLGYGVPDRPDIGKKTQPATSNEEGGSTNGSSIWSASGTPETGDSMSPPSPLVVPVGVVSTISFSTSDSLTGTVTFDVTLKDRLFVQQIAHEKFVSQSAPAMFYETWFLYRVVQEYSTGIHGGVGGTSNNSLTTTQTGLAYTYLETATAGTPPAPPAPMTRTLTIALDYLQTGLDVAGLVPVLGEGADALNAGIHVCRGNYGEATISMAAMIPVGGQAVTVGKFANKAAKAVARNADHLDEVADAARAIALNADGVATTACSAPKPLSLTNRPHGGPEHDAAIMDKIAELGKDVGDIRKNQTQVNALGQKVSNLRPDLQWTDAAGVRHYFQAINKNPATRIADLLKFDPAAVAEVLF